MSCILVRVIYAVVMVLSFKENTGSLFHFRLHKIHSVRPMNRLWAQFFGVIPTGVKKEQQYSSGHGCVASHSATREHKPMHGSNEHFSPTAWVPRSCSSCSSVGIPGCRRRRLSRGRTGSFCPSCTFPGQRTYRWVSCFCRRHFCCCCCYYS